MTPAQKAGLKIGDKIRVTRTKSCYVNVGDILVFDSDDYSDCPWFNHEDPSCIIHNITKVAFDITGEPESQWEKVPQRFSNMAFSIEDDPKLMDTIQQTLYKMGYEWVSGECVDSLYTDNYESGRCVLKTDVNGYISRNPTPTDEEFNAPDNKINIHWMRTYIEPEPVKEIIIIGDKTYIKDELEIALANINPVEG